MLVFELVKYHPMAPMRPRSCLYGWLNQDQAKEGLAKPLADQDSLDRAKTGPYMVWPSQLADQAGHGLAKVSFDYTKIPWLRV